MRPSRRASAGPPARDRKQPPSHRVPLRRASAACRRRESEPRPRRRRRHTPIFSLNVRAARARHGRAAGRRPCGTAKRQGAAQSTTGTCWGGGGAQLRLSRPIACEWGLRREGLFPLPRCSRVRWAAPGGRYRRCRSRPGPSAATLGQKAAAHNFLARPILPASGWAELRKGSPQPLAHFNIGFSSFFALVWAISTTDKALSAYATREDVSRLYRWRCPKRGIGARFHETLLRAARTARRRKSTHAYRRQRSCSETAKGSPATISRDRARMLGSKHGSSRQNGIAEAASGHVEFTDARPSLQLLATALDHRT